MNRKEKQEIDIIGLALFCALLSEWMRQPNVKPKSLSDDTLQTARNHRCRSARRRRFLRPDGFAPASDGLYSRQRPLGLRPVPDLLRQRAGRGRLFEIENEGMNE